MRRTSNAPLASLRPGALRDAKAIRASAAKTLTMCNGVLLLPRSYAPRSALPSMATTPVSLIPLALAKAAVNLRKALSKASGSSARSTRLNVSWLGRPCSNGRNCRSNPSFERANRRHVCGAVRPTQCCSQRDDDDVEQIVKGIGRPRVWQATEDLPEFLHWTPPAIRESPSESMLPAAATALSNPHAIPLPHKGEGNDGEPLPQSGE